MTEMKKTRFQIPPITKQVAFKKQSIGSKIYNWSRPKIEYNPEFSKPIAQQTDNFATNQVLDTPAFKMSLTLSPMTQGHTAFDDPILEVGRFKDKFQDILKHHYRPGVRLTGNYFGNGVDYFGDGFENYFGDGGQDFV